jgi:hypothetical protein
VTCKRAHHPHAFSALALFVAVLAILVALATPGALAAMPPLFLPAVTYHTGDHNPVSLAVADLNNDGKPDIVVVNQFTGADFSIGGSTVGVLLGNGDGTFQSAVTYDSGGSFAVGWLPSGVTISHARDASYEPRRPSWNVANS